uniref:Vigilin n=1 Tax=Cyprinus carpio TaxID=7962 RepID=A0A8C1RXE2_CYPCA
MSSVAVLTQESFAEHRSGLKDGDITEDEAYIPTYLEAFPPLPDKGTPGEKTGEPARAWSKIRPIKASVITQVFHVPLEERRYKDNSQFGEGEEAKVCLDIMQKTGAHIELSLAKDQGLSIMVTGKLDSVMKARKEIVARLQTQASATVLIPKEHHRFVIGKNGEKLQELELKTATKIAIPRSDDPNANIRISGTKDGIEKARHEIQLISAEQDKRAVERLSFEKAFHPFIAGAYNRLVQELSQETGARISIPPPSIPKDEIVITGEKEAVAMAIARIRAIYEEKKCKTTTISVEVKKSQHKYIVGPKGNTLQEILENTGVSVEMPPLDSSSETIILRGEPDKLGPALTQVYAKAKSVIVVEVIAPAWLHRFIIGKKGQNISRITQQLPKVHIEFTDGEERISLEGPTEEVEQAQAQIQEIIKDLMARMDYAEINIDQRFHRHLIGKNGANINRIKEQYKVSVRIPQDSERCGLVRIEGDPQGVQLARKELMDMAQRMENERTKDLIIEQKFHRTIIGQKGEKIKEVRDKFPEVIIIFPDQQQKSDIVQLRGPKNEVEKCAKFLQKLIAELVESSFSISVPIHKQFHKNIIGKGGANIKKIREETNTKIDLPTENSNSEMIVITGKKSSCEAARDRILTIQKELANLKEAEVSIPAKLHNSLIGSKGSLVRSVMEECGGVHIHFPAEGSGLDKVTIRGPAEEVERARRQLLQLAEEKVKPSWDPKAAEYNKLHGNMKFRSNFQTEMNLQVSSFHSQRLFFSLLKDDYDIYELYYFLYLWLAAQEAASQENGDTDLIPRKCDIITVMGRAEKCELARAALLALVPVTIDVEVSFDLHRYIIGQKGAGIRKMMEEYEVNIWVPQPEQQSDIIKITGQVASVERAKQGLLERVKELQAEQEDRALRSYKVTLSVDPKYHPKIIGRKGAVISQIRKDYDVNVQFPDKGDEQQDVIVISGYERSANEARAAIEQLVAALQDMVSEDIRLDRRVHARIIGARGKAIRKLMEEFKVDIRFPQPGSEDPSKVTVTGLPENVDNAIDHLLNLEEEYVSLESTTMGTGGNDEDNKALAKGFVVRDAPWNAQGNKAPDMSSAEEFPTFGSGIAPKQTSAWGPKKC